MSYKHLSLEERHYLELELKAGSTLNKIAKKLLTRSYISLNNLF